MTKPQTTSDKLDEIESAIEAIEAGDESSCILPDALRSLLRDCRELHKLVREDDDVEIDARWLRELTNLPACKNDLHGGYKGDEVTLFLNDWESVNKKESERFWVLTFSLRKEGWQASVSVQENSRHNGRLYMGVAKTREDARRIFQALGIELKEPV